MSVGKVTLSAIRPIESAVTDTSFRGDENIQMSISESAKKPDPSIVIMSFPTMRIFPSLSKGITSPPCVKPPKVTLIPAAPIEIRLLDLLTFAVVALPPIRIAPSPGSASGASGASGAGTVVVEVDVVED
jgi:hypothetical protein